MSPVDKLIHGLYAAIATEDWRTARERGLEAVAGMLGARTAAWLTHGEGSRTGAYTQLPRSAFSQECLAALEFADAEALRPESSGLTLCLRYRHLQPGVTSVMALRWLADPGKALQDRAASVLALAAQLLAHLAEASALSMKLFVQRDEWQQGAGRAPRGAAALVDARGCLHASTGNFTAGLQAATGELPLPARQLPFELPVSGQDEDHSFQRLGLRFSVVRMDSLYLVHLRPPLPLDVLSEREQQIARALGAGKSLKSVAQQYGLAVSTVANHAARIYRKLGIFRREELMEILRSLPVQSKNQAGV